MRIITASFSCGAALAATLIAAPALALVVDLTPGQINGNDTNTASFTDGMITLTPFVGDTQSTFNPSSVRLGIDGTGTNANAFNDPDVDPNNGNEEKLQFQFASGVGLSRIAYDFSRADGPGLDDGVIITGFLVDPQVSFSISNPTLFANYAAGRLRLNIPGGLFSGTAVDINFGVPSASAGQTLLLSVTDTTQAGAQLAITGISYDDDVEILGDVDGINGVTIEDFNIIRDNFFNTGVIRTQGDLTGDGKVSIADFEQWKSVYPGNGEAMLSQLFSQGAPEPSSALLLAVGGVALASRRRRSS
jgi:hypothetical protein